MPSVIILNAFMLSAIMLSAIMWLFESDNFSAHETLSTSDTKFKKCSKLK